MIFFYSVLHNKIFIYQRKFKFAICSDTFINVLTRKKISNYYIILELLFWVNSYYSYSIKDNIYIYIYMEKSRCFHLLFLHLINNLLRCQRVNAKKELWWSKKLLTAFKIYFLTNALIHRYHTHTYMKHIYVIAKHIFDKGLIYKLHKELNIKNTSKSIKNWLKA